MDKGKGREIRPLLCHPESVLSLRAMLQELSLLLVSVAPGVYTFRVQVLAEDRYSVPGEVK